MSIAFLIPVTSRGRNWTRVEESYLYTILLPNFIAVCKDLKTDLKSTPIESRTLHFFIGYDTGDEYYTRHIGEFSELFLSRLPCTFHVGCYDNPTRSCVFIWNKLFEAAVSVDYIDYFFQLGDDIKFTDFDLLKEVQHIMSIFEDKCMVWPLDSNNQQVPTQSVVSRHHWKIFGYYFHPSIQNWYCDDWIGGVYSGHCVKTKGCVVHNSGGEPRYNIKGVDNLKELMDSGRRQVNKYFLELGK